MAPFKHCDYQCYLNVKVPRIKCDRHKVLVIGEIPWGRLNIHFTHLFEQEVMKLCAEMSVSAVAKQLGEVDTNIREHLSLSGRTGQEKATGFF